MAKDDTVKLVRSEQEIRDLKLMLFTKFMYTLIALSDNVDEQITNLATWADITPSILAESYFGRTDN